MPAEQWEYLTETHIDYGHSTPYFLATLGDNRWELISVSTVPYRWKGDAGDEHQHNLQTFVFKRRKEPTA